MGPWSITLKRSVLVGGNVLLMRGLNREIPLEFHALVKNYFFPFDGNV